MFSETSEQLGIFHTGRKLVSNENGGVMAAWNDIVDCTAGSVTFRSAITGTIIGT